MKRGMAVEGIRRENALNIPNLLTIFRMALMPAIAWHFLRGQMRAALIVYLAAMLSDLADGFIARRFGQVTSLGKLLDPIADKLCLLTILALFAADGQIPVWLMNIMLLKEAILVLGSTLALKHGIVVSALPIGKWTTFSFVLSTMARFLSLRQAADILLWASAILSFAALIWYSAAFIKRLQTQKAIA
ncbi:MAG: CDP-alcohol phosphatidyltransferase family protein [Clostridia bacterium]|nr:CDP-alcohol phosphatidyltransferase family protein [Clostridia bacterium]